MNKKYIIGIMFALLLAIPLGVAAQSASPGSINTVFGIPVSQSFTGLTASTEYELRCTSNSNASTITFDSDSDGEATVTVTAAEYGQNNYALWTAAGSGDVLTFTIDNMDIMPYIVILITVSILFSVIGMFTKGKLF